ncbi:MAG: PilZ domain-containing protein [Magnetococcus sp. DMHC-6]
MQEDVKKLLTSTDFLMDENEIRLLIEEAIKREIALEILLDDKPEGFRSHLLKNAEQGELLIAPLAPASGNIRIRQSRKIKLRFVLGIHAIEMSVTFQNSETFLNMETGQNIQVIRLTYPRALHIVPQRRLLRLNVPEENGCAVLLNRRKEADISGRLRDIHMEGMGILVSTDQLTFDRGDRVHAEIQFLDKSYPNLHFFGTICYRFPVRDRDNTERMLHRYGYRFTDIDEYLLLQKFLDILRGKQSGTRDVVDIQKMMEEIFGSK